MADAQDSQLPPPERNLAPLEVWAAYARERFKWVDARITDYRSWARQLAAAIAVVIGLGMTLVARLALDERPTLDPSWRTGCLVVFFAILAVQVWTLRRALLVGYQTEAVVEPERPSLIVDYVAAHDEVEAHRVTGAQYANAYDRFRTVSDRLGENVASATRVFQRTLAALLVAVTLLAVGALWPRGTSGRRNPLPDELQPAQRVSSITGALGRQISGNE